MTNLWTKNIKPMLLGEIEKPFDSDDYIYEIKFDGIRAIIYAEPNKIKIVTRNLKDITSIYPELQNISKLVKRKTIFDGEIVMFDNSKSSFQKLQERSHLKNIKKINNLSVINPVSFVCFDILYDGKDITKLNLISRKEILDTYDENDYFIKSPYIRTKGKKLFNLIKKENLEGIIAKKINSTYQYNIRSNDWLKIKNLNKGIFYIGGYSYKDTHVFSIYLGEYENNKFNFVGKVFVAKKDKLFDKILKLKKTKSYFQNYENENTNFIKPTIKCKIKYLERTKNGSLRQPVFMKEEI